MKESAIVFLGGGLGATLRYWLSANVYRVLGTSFPYGTLVVNVIGCFFLGFLMTLFEERFVVQPLLRIFLTIGVLGGFTTFSTFSYETMALLREGSYLSATANVVYSMLNCLGAAWIGGVIGKMF